MKTIPYRCDDTRHKALLGVARSTGTSVQRLFDNFVTHVIAERQAEARFVARQERAEIRKPKAEHAARNTSPDNRMHSVILRPCKRENSFPSP